MKKGMVCLSALWILTAWIGMAAAGDRAGHICFRRIDADQDGKVSLKEFAVYYGEDKDKFKAADTDGDGRLTHDEYHDFLGHGAQDRQDG